MIEELRIRGLGVIDEAELELGPGLTVLTGETGAGKTLVMTGLALLLGARADAGLVRRPRPRATVEGTLRVAPDGPVAMRVGEAGGDVVDGQLVLARTVGADGRSRAYAGGRGAPLSLLAEVAGDLVAVHGQGDQSRLTRPARQRAALDRFAGTDVAGPLDAYARDHAALREVQAQLAERTGRARERLAEAELLGLGLREIAAVDPRPGEDAALAAESVRLGHAAALRGAAQTAQSSLAGDDAGPEQTDMLTLLGLARRALAPVRDHDAALAALADRLAEVAYLTADVAADLAGYVQDLEVDPARIAAVEHRRSQLAGLLRAYGPDVAAVLGWAQRARDRVEEVDGDEERIATLTQRRDELRARLAAGAASLSGARTRAAARLGTLVSRELADLAMPQARVDVVVTQTRLPEPRAAEGLTVGGVPLAYGPTGVDDVEMLLRAHPAAPPRPLGAGASGGELSRVMLAVEVVLAGTDAVPTLVFDEVDAGIGGRAAIEVGRRLARLARTAQVVVVTHLPQVAAFADRHLVVVKTEDGSVTRSGVTLLDEAGRVRELSRMLAGLEGSSTAEAHAQELLAVATATRHPG